MSLTRTTFVYTGGPQEFNTNFALGVLEPEHVKVIVDGYEDSLGQPILLDNTYDPVTGKVTIINYSLQEGDTGVIFREVPIGSLIVDFEQGADVTRRNLTRMSTHLLHAVQEVKDQSLEDNERIDDFLEEVVDSVDQLTQEAVTARNDALGFAGQSATSASNAETSAVIAQSAYQGRQYTTRENFAAETAYVNGVDAPADGTVVTAGGLAYVRSTGATALPGLSGWLPFGDVTPGHFGSVGDGVADDTAALQAAMDYATGYVDLPSGVYRCSGIAYTKPPMLRGAGNDGPGMSQILHTGTGYLFEPATGVNPYGTIIKDVRLTGPGRDTGGTQCGFRGRNTGSNRNILFERVFVEEFPLYGVMLTDAFSNAFEDCRFRRCGAHEAAEGAAVRYENRVFGENNACTGDHFDNCYFSASRRGVETKPGDRFLFAKFTNSFFEYCGHGVWADQGELTTFDSCYFEGNSISGATVSNGIDFGCRTSNTGNFPTDFISYLRVGTSFGRFDVRYIRADTAILTIDQRDTVRKVSQLRAASGAVNVDGATVHRTDGDPTGQVFARRGSIAFGEDGASRDKVLWVKATGPLLGSETGWRAVLLRDAGVTSARPALDTAAAGYQFFDTSLNRPVWWTGTGWVGADGTVA